MLMCQDVSSARSGNGESDGRPPPSSSLSPPLRRTRTSSAPPRIGLHRKRRSLVEHHYRVDPTTQGLLPGLPTHEDDWERDLHDFFNLVSLVPVVVLNSMNWDWDVLLDPFSTKTLKHAWLDDCDWFPLFFAVAVGVSRPRCSTLFCAMDACRSQYFFDLEDAVAQKKALL